MVPQAEERVSELLQRVESLQASQASSAQARKAAEARAAEAERHAHSLEECMQTDGPMSNGHAGDAPAPRPRSAEPPAMAGPGQSSIFGPRSASLELGLQHAVCPVDATY